MNAAKMRIFVTTASIMLAGMLAGCAITSAVRMRDQQTIPIARMIEEVTEAPLVFVGEIHDDPKHHELQYQVIKGLHDAGKPLAIGLEMFNAENQAELDAWVEGRFTPARFAEVYAKNWKEPLSLYADIFRYARANRIPLVGLNVPRGLIQGVKQNGLQALPEEVRRKLPADFRCDMTGDYLVFMEKVLSGHRGNKEALSHFCEAMMLWNNLMAQNLSAYLESHPGSSVVVLAGAGHARKKWGIPGQLERGQKQFTYRVILPELLDVAGLPRATSADADYLTVEPDNPFFRFLVGY